MAAMLFSFIVLLMLTLKVYTNVSFQSRPNAIKLIRQMSLYYGQGAGHLLQYISIFNNAPDKFQYSDLIQEYNNMKKFLESWYHLFVVFIALFVKWFIF